MKLSDLIEEYLLEQRCRGNTADTLEYYDNVLSYFRDFLDDLDVNDLSLADCRRYLLYQRDRSVSSTTVQSYVRGVRAFLTWAFNNDYIEENIPYKFRLPKAARPLIAVLTDAEIRRLYDAVEYGDAFHRHRNRLILALFLDCGLRLSELVTLSLRRVFLDERYFIVTGKGQKDRAVSFGYSTDQMLRAYLPFVPRSANTLILKKSVFGDVEPITETAIKQLFRKLQFRSGIERLYPHLLRHTFATRYIENGGSIYDLRDILGHTSLSMTMRYVHLAQTRIRSDFDRFSPLDKIKRSEF